MPNISLARAISGVQARTVGQGVRILSQQEEERERAAELERALKSQSRTRKAQEQSSKGRLFGGGLGGLLGAILAPATGGLSYLLPALGAAGGSFAGQKFATGSGGGLFGVTAGDVGLGRRAAAKEKLKDIDIGSFQKARGRERETEFRAGEEAFGGDLASLIGAGAIQDFQTAFAFSLLPGLFGGGAPAGKLFEEQAFASLLPNEANGLQAIIKSMRRA